MLGANAKHKMPCCIAFLILCKSMERKKLPLLSVPSTFLFNQLVCYFNFCFLLLSLQILQPLQWYRVIISPLEHALTSHSTSVWPFLLGNTRLQHSRDLWFLHISYLSWLNNQFSYKS